VSCVGLLNGSPTTYFVMESGDFGAVVGFRGIYYSINSASGPPGTSVASMLASKVAKRPLCFTARARR